VVAKADAADTDLEAFLDAALADIDDSRLDGNAQRGTL
jgi:hypothetical protein